MQTTTCGARHRVANDPRLGTELKAFSARTIDAPACYIGGDRDWATYQSPGAFEGMRHVCSQLVSVRLIDQAGHSLMEERPQQVNEALLDFLGKTQRTAIEVLHTTCTRPPNPVRNRASCAC